MDYRQALAWLYGLGGYEARGPEALRAGHWGLERSQDLLQALHQPHLAFQALHIAGTKGKGSTAAMASSILRAAGRRTGLYTSPHLTSFRERIQVDGQPIDLEQVIEGVRVLQRHPIPGLTSFEAFTALAFWAFRRARVEWAVVEVGLGGRLDSTNVLRPRATAITPIGLEHTRILGSRLREIALEKAGILKPGVPLTLGEQPAQARKAILERAGALGLAVREVGRDFKAELESIHPPWQRFRVVEGLPASVYELPLLGEYQIGNALTAMALIEAGLGTPAADTLKRGLAATVWPGRLEILAERPWVVVDAAHTLESTRTLCQALERYMPARRTYWIFATLTDKPAQAMLEVIQARSQGVFLPPFEHPRAVSPQELGGGGVSTLDEAFDRALELAGAEDRIVASGSVAFAGAVRLAWLRRTGQPLPAVDPV